MDDVTMQRLIEHEAIAATGCTCNVGELCQSCHSAAELAEAFPTLRADLAAMKARAEAAEAERNALLFSLIGSHPMPWRIDSDWCVEVIDSGGDVVAKLRTREAAQALIERAKACLATAEGGASDGD